MKEVIALIVVVAGIVSVVGYLVFYVGLMSGAIRIYKGDLNATQDIAKSIGDEIVISVKRQVILTFVSAIAGALGLGSLVAFLKKL